MTRFAAFGLVLAVLLVVSCSEERPVVSPTTTTASDPATTTPMSPLDAFPVTVGTGDGALMLSRAPQRIASLSASHVEMLFALGAGDRVIAGDLFSDYPAEAAGLTRIDSFNLNVEAVIELDPDLVILSFDPGGAVDGLTAVGIPVLMYPTPASLEDALDQLRDVGSAAGLSTRAGELAAAVEERVAVAVASVAGIADGMTFYHETDPFTFFTPNSDSFIGSLYALFGMENIADAAPDEFGGGFPQLSAEYIIEADPDIVFLGSSGYGETPETLAARPGWSTMSAVRDGRTVLLDADVASRWGPRIAELVESIAAAVAEQAP